MDRSSSLQHAQQQAEELYRINGVLAKKATVLLNGYKKLLDHIAQTPCLIKEDLSQQIADIMEECSNQIS